MARFIPKKFNGKMAEPMIPFFAAGIIVAWAIKAGGDAYMQSPEFRYDSRNPRAERNKAEDAKK